MKAIARQFGSSFHGRRRPWAVPQDVPPLRKRCKRRGVAVRPMNERIARLREESVRAEVRTSGERAGIITEFYQSGIAAGKSFPVQRAMAFRYLMEHVSLPVEDGQLIVGLRRTWPQETPTYPEMCTHSPEGLEILDLRENMPCRVDDQTGKLYASKVIPAWRGRTLREIIFDNLSSEWLDAYQAGIWTEFMEQRAPGHTAGGERIFRSGLLDLKQEIRTKMLEQNTGDPEYFD